MMNGSAGIPHPIDRLLYGQLHLQPDPLGAFFSCITDLVHTPEAKEKPQLLPLAMAYASSQLRRVGHPDADLLFGVALGIAAAMTARSNPSTQEQQSTSPTPAEGSIRTPLPNDPAVCEPKPPPKTRGAWVELSNGEMVRVPPAEGTEPFPMYFYDRSRKN
ncbi:hypothetical protein [Polyangium sp. y55x31]|uniref:hypothetical protein n=1 Tax=Polyangium sp. y55x31 TaxID=3042688 RepID=UPI002482F94B|nr:hypothetical protein [Polyangium sp. y55x31]MDI1480402.1 hypothetical protein [Polyangium sp. y55x31]